jgi:hypothetical protein
MGKHYQHWSTESLIEKRKYLEEDIADYNRTLSQTKSLLITLSLTHAIKRAKESIHAIDAELCYRNSGAAQK